MMKVLILRCTAGLVLAASVSGWAQDIPSSNKLELARQFLATRKGFSSLDTEACVSNVLAELPETPVPKAQATDIICGFLPTLRSNAIQVVASHFTEDELWALVHQTNSPAMVRYHKLRPHILEELDALGDRYIDEHPELLKSLMNEPRIEVYPQNSAMLTNTRTLVALVGSALPLGWYVGYAQTTRTKYFGGRWCTAVALRLKNRYYINWESEAVVRFFPADHVASNASVWTASNFLTRTSSHQVYFLGKKGSNWSTIRDSIRDALDSGAVTTNATAPTKPSGQR